MAPGSAGGSAARPQAIDCDGADEQRAREDARELRRQRREVQAVPQHRQREQARKRAPERPAPAEHRGAAENDRGDRIQLVAVARVRFRLPQMRDVHDRLLGELEYPMLLQGTAPKSALLEEFRTTETGDECPAAKSFFGRVRDYLAGC